MTTATTTSHSWPPLHAVAKTAHLPMNPLVSGMPAKLSMNSANTAAASGERRPRPIQLLSSVASPVASRTMVTSANAPIVAAP